MHVIICYMFKLQVDKEQLIDSLKTLLIMVFI